jgi:hypothetical protein
MDRRRRLIALGIYLALALAYVALMPRERLVAHSPYNHYALQAEAWLSGRLDLGGPPPSYTGNNDFALFQDKHYVSFPPVPAAMILPLVGICGSAESTPDALFFALLAPVGPVLLFFLLERLRTLGRSRRSERESLLLALLFGLGTVYWFTAVQGTVWFAGHVVSVALLCGSLLCSLQGRHPLLAGLLLGLAFGTRPNVGFAVVFLACEQWRALAGARSPRALLARATWLGPLMAVAALLAWHNWARFGDPFEFGHRMLTVAWRERIEEHGLFSLVYLGRNLSVVLASLPFVDAEHGLRINGHGLALWLTSPFYLWAWWPRRTNPTYWAAAASALVVALPALLYQNTGWLQFGYRFSNDFAPLLFVMIAVGRRPLRLPFWILGALALSVNAFGAMTFGKAAYAEHYFIDRSQRVLHPTDR